MSLAACLLDYVETLEWRRADRDRFVVALCTGDGRLVDTVKYVVQRGWLGFAFRVIFGKVFIPTTKTQKGKVICYF